MALLGFPNPVNELAARSVAAGVLALSLLTLVLWTAAGGGWLWLTAVLAYGFLARVLTGPRLSPLGQLATRVIAPRLGPARLVPGPPKRFAQGIGATLAIVAVVAHFGFGADVVALVAVAMIAVAATLEAGFGLCLGCKAFAVLMRAGIIPERVCLECADISARLAAAR